MVAREAHNLEVAGSIPAPAIWKHDCVAIRNDADAGRFDNQSDFPNSGD